MCCCRFENIWNALPQTCKSNVNKNSNYFELALSSPFSQEIQIIELWNSVEGLPPLPRSFCLLLFPTHIPIQPQTKPTRSNTHLPTHTHTLLSIPFSESISFMNDSSCPGIKRHVVTQIKYHWLRRFHLNQTNNFWRLLVRLRVGWADLGDKQQKFQLQLVATINEIFENPTWHLKLDEAGCRWPPTCTIFFPATRGLDRTTNAWGEILAPDKISAAVGSLDTSGFGLAEAAAAGDGGSIIGLIGTSGGGGPSFARLICGEGLEAGGLSLSLALEAEALPVFSPWASFRWTNRTDLKKIRRFTKRQKIVF